ncbi:MAG TPA: DMT family transporter [Thermoanaerobaculia bacterium]|nr:DMT family transporter [Thermoanaerobaculia bacterium]
MSDAPTASTPADPAAAAPSALTVHAALITVQLIFGGFYVVGKAVLREMEPLALAALRVAFAAPLLACIAWRHDHVRPRGRDLSWLALLGLLGVTANQGLFITGLKYTTATNAAILMPSIPVFTAAVAALLRIEPLTRQRLLGVALSVAGALVLINPLRFATGGQTARGNLLILVNCFCFALFLVLQRPLFQRVPWRTVIAGSFVFGALGVLPLSGPALAALDPGKISAGAWLGVAYIVLFSTTIAYAVNTWAVRRSSPALVAAYTTLQPLATALLAAAFLGETFGWAEGLGLGLIVAGLWQVSR